MEMRSPNLHLVLCITYPVWPQNAQQEIGIQLHWQVRPIQPVILFPVGILWPNRVLILGEIILQICFAEENSWFNSFSRKKSRSFHSNKRAKNCCKIHDRKRRGKFGQQCQNELLAYMDKGYIYVVVRVAYHLAF